MNRRDAVLALLALGAPLPVMAQQAPGMPRIGMLFTGSPESAGVLLDAFKQGLAERGYIDGQNLIIEPRWARGLDERLPQLAAELVRLDCVVIVVASTTSAFAAKNATQTIPIVMATSTDPVEAGLIQSLARPGGNVTGNTGIGAQLTVKVMELAKVMVPRSTRVAILMTDHPSHGRMWADVEKAARTLKLVPFAVRSSSPAGLEAAIAEATKGKAGSLFVLPDPWVLHSRVQLATLASKARLPTLFTFQEHVQAGGVLSYGVQVADQFRSAAVFVDKILKGAKPSDLPVEQATKLELVVNLKAAKAIGLAIPQSILVRADLVIE